MAFLLVTSSGKLKGKRLEINKNKVTIGRAPDNDISTDDSVASAWHCSVVKDGKKYSLMDLNSTNGTRLNEEFVKSSHLKPKDVIRVGSLEILFDGEDVEVQNTAGSPSEPSTPSFEARKESKSVFLPIIISLAVLAVLAACWFLFRLLVK